MKGRVHSVQSLGAVDGPGVRYVVFLQGCPLRCAYCHNPDTWDFAGGTEREAAELVKEICRFKPYFGTKGGVTVSGGEPLQQAPFVEELFRLLHEEGIHTALDTSGVGDLKAARRVLEHTDLVLGDLKFATAGEYRTYCKADMDKVLAFYRLVSEMKVPLWVRHVVVPGLNDTLEDMGKIKSLAESFPTLEKIEWLPFHNLCLEKYQQMGIPFPLEGTDNMDELRLEALVSRL
ncbi:pyruvate formate-lyase activating enzyme [Clostridium sp. CAG:1013]|nr:pyruvate formate-lyase activating enzyme [Clostridium sp. CAG:1013]